ncbi:MAG: hypothetical protein JEZ05_06290 [Tenericutes bacterium]|nr:hypothetical protein [Mycoplasmatota bacterium]
MHNPSSKNKVPTELGEQITNFLLDNAAEDMVEQANQSLKISYYYKKDDKFICVDNTT